MNRIDKEAREKIKKEINLYRLPNERLTVITFGLLHECDQLEADCQGYKNGQLQLQDTVNTLMDSNAKLAERVKELERKLESSKLIREAEKKILIKEVEKNKELTEGIEKILISDICDYGTNIKVIYIEKTIYEELQKLLEGIKGVMPNDREMHLCNGKV